jgi:hypothetical protein
VGGYAVIYHAQPRFTKDIDLFIKADPANAQAIYAALASFGAPLEGIRPEEFAEPGSFFRFGHDPHGFDILPEIPGVDFEAAWERRVEGVIDRFSSPRPTSLRRNWPQGGRRISRMRRRFARLPKRNSHDKATPGNLTRQGC